ncbi:complex I subunit 5 family protein [Pseudomonas sp.]|uniref:complex I subunit 5 family protein n=1 Tax=Pseudomonas sp. TaxID=306 RepID=UPI002729BFFF|nr:complex I subunit 5 family protein [Pseudomonas sp.]
MTDYPWLLLVILAPGLGLLLMLRRPYPVMNWVWLGCLPALAVSLWPVAPVEFARLWPDAALAVDDPWNRAWLGFTSLLWACATRYAAAGMDHDPHRLRFWFFWTAVMTGNFLLILAQDVITFYTAFTLLSLSAYALIIHQGGPGPRHAGRLYLELAVLGEIFISVGLLLRVLEANGSLAMAGLQEFPISPWTAVLLFAGFGIKAGFWPLHVWLPRAHPVAPAAASAVLSGTLIKAGLLGLWRFLPSGDPLMQDWAGVLLAAGFVGILFGVALGLIQTRAKVVLAYSSVSQMGFLVVVLALVWEVGAAAETLPTYYVVHHGLAKGALFLGAGMALHGRLTRPYWYLLFVPALALAGLPLTTGAAAKSAIKTALQASAYEELLMLLIMGALGTMLVLLRALWLMRPAGAESPPVIPPAGQGIPLVVLCLMPVILPWAWPELRELLWKSLGPGASWSLIWPILLASGVAVTVITHRQRLTPVLERLAHPLLVMRLKRLIQAYQHEDGLLHRSRWRHWERFIDHVLKVPTVRGSAWILLALALLGWWAY